MSGVKFLLNKNILKTAPGKIFTYLVMAFVIVISVCPFIWLLISSFKTNSEILESAFSWPATPSFYGYKIAFQVAKIHMRFITSITVTAICTILSLFIYGMASYVIARYSFKLKNFIFALLVSSIMMPAEAMIQPIYSLINSFGLYDTKAALVIVYTGFALPMCLFLMRSYFTNLPKELEESAYIEGAGFFTTFLSIIIPVAKPVLMSAGIMTFIISWNELLYALLLTSSEGNRTLPLSMRYFIATFTFNYPAMLAAMVMSILPTIVVYVVLQEQIAESMVAGAIKG